MMIRMLLRVAVVITAATSVAHGQFPRPKPSITSVEPRSGVEGTVVTIKGQNFPTDYKNTCVVLGGMAAMGSVEPNPTASEIKVKIGAVAEKAAGDVLLWPGTAIDLHLTDLSFRDTTLKFSATKLFRNGAPVTLAGVNFELTSVSPNTYAGHFQGRLTSRVDLGGLERGGAVRMAFPRDLQISDGTIVDVVFMLKEPTLAIGFSAEISGRLTNEDVLRVIAKGVEAAALSIGERVEADVVRNDDKGEWELYVSKPYLENGIGTVRFRDKNSKVQGPNW